MNTRVKWLVLALAMSGIAGGAIAQTSADPSTPPAANSTGPGQRHWHHHGPGMMMGGGLLRAFRQLNLTAAQQQNVKSILQNAHQQFAAERQAGGGPDFSVLSNPGDPNYASAMQSLQSRMAERLQQRAQIQQQLYGVLTAEQKTQLPGILANMKAKMAQHTGGAA